MSSIDKSWKCASFFAGVGGIDLGFEIGGAFTVVYANEFDRYPVKTYELNFPIKVDERDICSVPASDIPTVDVIMAGFPCQAFSVAGYRQGFADAKGRGTLFFEVARIIEQKKPQVVFLENVKNLVSHDQGRTFAIIRQTLVELGYTVKHQVFNAMTHGNVPQNRERIYIVAFRDKQTAERFQFPNSVPLTCDLTEIIDFVNPVAEKYYYTPGKYAGNLYEKLIFAMDDERAVYQWRRTYVRKNKSGVIPTLTANQGMGGHNVCLIKTPYGIRKMTPAEYFRAQGFPENFILPTNMADSRLYKQAGNSVCVTVIANIAQEIEKAFN